MSSAAAGYDGARAVAVEGLVVGYGGVIALDGVSISAGTAAITAVLGANGAGKTTLLRALSGLIRPMAGEVRFLGRRIDQRPALAVIDEIDVHMIEEKRQRQPGPQNPRRDFDRVPGRRQRGKSEVERFLHRAW